MVLKKGKADPTEAQNWLYGAQRARLLERCNRRFVCVRCSAVITIATLRERCCRAGIAVAIGMAGWATSAGR